MQTVAPTAPSDPHAARTTDPAALRRQLHALWRYLRMHGASAHEADDLAQEAFVVALQKGADRADPAALAVFLRRTGRFLFLRARAGGRPAEQLATAVDQLWDRDCAHDRGDGLLAALRACVERLDGRARRAVELSYGIGADDPSSRARVAVELGMKENGVKTLLQRVRQTLRECVQRSKT